MQTLLTPPGDTATVYDYGHTVARHFAPVVVGRRGTGLALVAPPRHDQRPQAGQPAVQPRAAGALPGRLVRAVTTWADVANRWPDRLEVIASHIPPGSSVIDLGAGAQGLRPLLRDCAYTPADLHQRSNDTLAFDMNGGVWPEGHWDVAVMAGVLEYAANPRIVLAYVRRHARTAIVTYRHARSKGDRRADLFRNALNPDQFAMAAHKAGWRKVMNLGDRRTEAGGKYRVWRLL